jgi:serine/threonine-protein kinase
MDNGSTSEPRTAGPATQAEADVHAALSALLGLSEPTEVEVEPPALPRGERYTRLRLHARGGLGQVWLGRDELVGRDVAIKEPRADRPGPAARAALERETWVLGQLQHPNIVPLFDLVRGSNGGAAFYVMPFLGGDGLHDLAARFHRSRPPGPATRLALLPLLTAFLDVCAALDHAHGRGVWHLDIKGENVKLGPTGAAVVLDWGLARLAAPAAGEPPTRPGAAGGTPAFMAPEQAESCGRLGPHTDVYGLGALLYLLLTGRPPHPEAAGCDRDGLAAALRRPVPPPRQVWPGVPAALEAVCRKALAPDPAGRYGSVKELRQEVRHWLADEPLSAYREPLPARLARWGRRHKRAVSGAAAVLVTAVLALAVGLVVVNRERRETDRQRQAAEDALALERVSFRQALKAGDDYFTAISQNRLLQEPGQQPLRRELLQRGLAYYQDFLTHRGDDPALQAEVAAAWSRVGQIQANIGTLPEARAAIGKAIALGEDLLAADPTNVDIRARLAQWYGTASTGTLRRAGQFHDALGNLDRATELAEGLPADHPQRAALAAAALSGRSFVLSQAGDLVGACAAAERAEAHFAQTSLDLRARRQRADTLVHLGLVRRDLKRLAAATEALSQGRQVFDGLRHEPGQALICITGIANCDNALGLVATDANDPARALAHFEAAYAARRQLAEENPAVLYHQSSLTATCLNLSRQHCSRGDLSRAAEFGRQACALTEGLVERNPTDIHYRTFAVRAHWIAGGYHEALGDWAAASRLQARAAELLAGFSATSDREVWRVLAQDTVADGVRQLRWGQWRSAAETFRQVAACFWRAGSPRSGSPPDQPPGQRANASRQ